MVTTLLRAPSCHHRDTWASRGLRAVALPVAISYLTRSRSKGVAPLWNPHETILVLSCFLFVSGGLSRLYRAPCLRQWGRTILKARPLGNEVENGARGATGAI